jgi:hypothetical protein
LLVYWYAPVYCREACSEVRTAHRGVVGCVLPTIINMSLPPPRLASHLELLITTRSTFTLGPTQTTPLCRANSAIALVCQTQSPTSSSAASSATLEHTEPATDRPTPRKRLESKRPKRGLRGLSGESAREFQLPPAGNIVLIRVRITERGL